MFGFLQLNKMGQENICLFSRYDLCSIKELLRQKITYAYVLIVFSGDEY